jgi:hypothetical protein
MGKKIDRPDQYVPLSVRFFTGHTGTKLREKFGRDGPLVWACYLAACKEHRPEGEIEYASEAEGWHTLGFEPDERPKFTLEGFFRYTGQLKKTRKTRSGHVFYVVCTGWERWHDMKRRNEAAERSARYRRKTKRDEAMTEDVTPPSQARDADRHLDGEAEVLKALASKAAGVASYAGVKTLPVETSEKVLRLMTYIGGHADDRTFQTVQGLADSLPEASLVKVLESIAFNGGQGVRNRAAYVVGALRNEKKERKAEADDIPF